MPTSPRQEGSECFVHASPRSQRPATLDTRKHGKTVSRPSSNTGRALNSPSTTPPATSRSSNGYAMRHSAKDAAGLDSNSPRNLATSASGGSYPNKPCSRRGSVTESNKQQNSHQRTASADVGGAWAAEALAQLSSPPGSATAATATLTTPISPRRYSPALSYSQRYNSTPATTTLQQCGSEDDQPCVAAQPEASATDNTATHNAAAATGGTVSIKKSASISPKANLLVQTASIPSSAAAGSLLEPPASTDSSPIKERNRLWGFDSPKREKSGGWLFSTEPSPTKDKTSNRFWGPDSALRKKKHSSKELSTATSTTAAVGGAVAAGDNNSSTGNDGQRAVLKKEGSSKGSKPWKSDAARAVASIFGGDGFSALRKSLSSSSRVNSAAVDAVVDTAEQDNNSIAAAAGSGVVSSAMASAEAADATIQQQQLVIAETERVIGSSVIDQCVLLQQQDGKHDVEGLSLLTQPAIPDPPTATDTEYDHKSQPADSALPAPSTSAVADISGGNAAQAAAAAGGASFRSDSVLSSSSSSSALTAAVDTSIPRSPSSLLSSSTDFRYSELLFRLQQFLPALKSSATDTENFEAVWELLKSELCGLVSTAKLASVQAGRLESLDAEVMQLQMMLVEVGRSVKQGAQQQQLQHLVQSFPSFARRQINADAAADRSALCPPAAAALGGESRSAAPCLMTPSAKQYSTDSKFITTGKPAAAEAGRVKSQGPSVQDKDVAAAAAAAAAGRRCSVGSSSAGSGMEVHNLLDHPDNTSSSSSSSSSSAAAAAAAAVSVTAGRDRYAGAYEVVRYPASAAASNNCSSRSRSPGAAASGGVFGISSRSLSSSPPCRYAVLPPAPKELTADEAAQLVGLYRAVRNDPERISYKKLPGRSRQHNNSSTSIGTSTSAERANNRLSSSPRRSTSPAPSPPAVAAAVTAVTEQPTSASPEHSSNSSPSAELLPAGISHFTLEVSAGDSNTEVLEAKKDTEAAVEPPATTTNGGGNASETFRNQGGLRGSWDYAHVGSGTALGGVTKGFRMIKTVPVNHSRQENTGSGSIGSPSCRTPTRDAAARASLSSLHSVTSSSPPQMLTAAAAVQLDLNHHDEEDDDHDHDGPRSAEIQASETSHSSSSSSPMARSSHRISHLQQESRSDQFNLNPSANATAGSTAGSSSGGSSILGYEYVRARSASPNLGLHYLDRSHIRPQKVPKSGSAAAAAAKRRHPLSYSTGSLSLGSANLRAVALAGMLNPAGDGAALGGSSSSTCIDHSRLPTVGAVWSGGLTLADDPAFRSACQAFRAEQDSCSSLNSSCSGSSSVYSSADPLAGSAKLVAKLSASPVKDAGSEQVDAAVHKFKKLLKSHGVPLKLERLGPFTFAAAGRKLRLRLLNGNLLVRSGGGCMDLLVALGKLPVTSSTNITN